MCCSITGTTTQPRNRKLKTLTSSRSRLRSPRADRIPMRGILKNMSRAEQMLARERGELRRQEKCGDVAGAEFTRKLMGRLKSCIEGYEHQLGCLPSEDLPEEPS